MYCVVYFLGYNTGDKFQFLCFIIYRDTTDFVFIKNTITTYDVISYQICIIQNREYLCHEFSIKHASVAAFHSCDLNVIFPDMSIKACRMLHLPASQIQAEKMS